MGGNTQSSNSRTLPGSPAASPPPGSSAPLTGKAFCCRKRIMATEACKRGVPTMQRGADWHGSETVSGSHI